MKQNTVALKALGPPGRVFSCGELEDLGLGAEDLALQEGRRDGAPRDEIRRPRRSCRGAKPGRQGHCPGWQSGVRWGQCFQGSSKDLFQGAHNFGTLGW